MAYSHVSEGLALLGRFRALTEDTDPTLAQASLMNEAVAARINLALAKRGLVTPIDGPPDLLAIAKSATMHGLAAEVSRVQFQASGGQNRNDSKSEWQRIFEEELKALADPTGLGSLGGETVLPGSYFTANPNRERPLGDIAEPKFT